MKIVFLGTPQAAVPTLTALLDAGHDVALVVCRPDRPAGRSGKPLPPAVKRAAVAHGLEVYQPTRLRRGAFHETLAARHPDLLVVVAYGRILPGPVLGIPRLGSVNVHFSLLPRYRGAAPVQWALARGETVTGVTTMRISERLDEGAVLLQEEVAIGEAEHAPELQSRLSDVGARLLLRTIDGLAAGTTEPRAQDPGCATYAPLLRRADGEADPSMEALELEGRVRGFDPWPGVWLRRAGKRIRLVEVRALGRAEGPVRPGRVGEPGAEGLPLECGGNSRLLLIRVQPEGGRVLTARDALNGRHLRPGDVLEGPDVQPEE